VDKEQIQKRQVEVIERMNALAEAAKKENRGLSQEEAKEFDTLEAEVESLKGSLERAERLEKLNQERAQSTSKPVDIKIVREAGEDEKGECKVWRSFGEQLQAVVGAAKNPYKMDSRLTQSDKLMRAATGLQESVLADGGFLVQQDFANEILARAYDTGVLASRVRRMSISSNSNGMKIPAVDEVSRANGSRWGGIQAYWEGEADAYTASKPKFKMMELVLKKLTGLYYATDEVLADASVLESVVSQGFAEEFGFKLDDAILNGDGAGKPLGILSSPSLVTVAKEGSQTAATINVNNLAKMRSRLYGRSRQNAVWLMNQDIEPQLLTLSISVGNNAFPVYLQGGTVAGEQYDTLFGRPTFPVEQCATLGTAGDILLVDPSQYLLIDKGQMQRAVSVHVRFLHDEQVFKFTYRVDGQPIWSSALTPFKGSTTQSPFVALAPRA
jgi:HK97 family phage major capsid protein